MDAKPSTSRNSLFGRIRSIWLPSRQSSAALVVFTAIISLGVFYYVDFQNREANFTKRAFRHLTLIGDTIALQTENYYKAILNAPPNIDEQYLTTFLPGIQFSRVNSKNYHENSIISEDDNYYLFLKLTPTKGGAIYLKAPILSLLRDRRSTTIGSDVFSDVLLADKDGRIIFELNQAGPRVIQLDALINAQDADAKRPETTNLRADHNASPNKFAEISTFSNLLDVRIAGAKHKLFLQPLYLKIGNSDTGPDRPHYVLCGVIRSDQFFIESLRVPYIVIIWTVFSALLLLFSLPLLKIFFIKSRERLLRGDVLRLCLLLPLVTFLLSLALIGSFYFIKHDETDRHLYNLAQSISFNFWRELTTIRAQINSLDQLESIRGYPKQVASFNRLPDALTRVVTAYGASDAYPFFNSVFWIDSSGHHKILWTVREKAPPLLDVSNRSYARDLLAKKYSYLYTGGGAEAPLTLEPINSWITGENSLVSCIPHPIGGAGLVSKPLSLIEPFIPPGFGYAVINSSGLVLFHSDESRNLVENLFEESDMNQSLIAAAKGRTPAYLNIFYRGKDYRFYITSFPQIDRLPWSLIVFREKAPLRIIYTDILLECVVGFVAVYVVICIVAYCLMRRRSTVQPRSKYLPRWLCPEERRFPQYVLLNLVFALLIIVAIAMTFVSSLAVLEIAAFSVPVFATVVSFVILAYGPTLKSFRSGGFKWRSSYLSFLLLFLMLIAFVPTLMFFKVCATYEKVLMSKRAQFSLAMFYQSRAEKIAAAYQRVNFPSAGKREEFLDARLKVGADALDSYEGTTGTLRAMRLPNNFHCGSQNRSALQSFTEDVLSRIRPSLDRFDRASTSAKYDLTGDLSWHSCKVGDILPGLTLDHYRGDQRLLIQSSEAEAAMPGNIWWYLCLSSMAFLIYAWVRFAAARLFPHALATLAQGSGYALPRPTVDVGNTLIICTVNAREQLSANGVYEGAAAILDIRRVGKKNVYESDSAWPDVDKHEVVVLDHFEFGLDDEAVDTAKRELLEELVVTRKKTVFVISTVDPLQYFTSAGRTLDVGNVHGSAHARKIECWAELLQSFSKRYLRCVADDAADSGASSQVSAGPDVLREECKHLLRLATIQREISCDLVLETMNAEEVIDEVADRADAYFRTLWVRLSVDEKLVLVQLSQEGVVNPHATQLVQQLIYKGLIVRDPNLRIFNESFKRFLVSVESPAQMKFWEQAGVKGGWASIRIMFWGCLICLVIFLLYTQRDLLQPGIALVTAIIGGAAALLKTLGELQKRMLGEKSNSHD